MSIEEELFKEAFAFERQKDGVLSLTFDEPKLAAYVRARLRALGEEVKLEISSSFSQEEHSHMYMQVSHQIDAAVERACGKGERE